MSFTLHGLAVSNGIAIGHAHLVSHATREVEHYVLPLLYPAGLTPGVQAWLGAFVVALNAAIYAVAILRWRRSRH